MKDLKKNETLINWMSLSLLLEFLIWCAFFTPPHFVVILALSFMWIIVAAQFIQNIILGLFIFVFGSISEKILTQGQESWDYMTTEIFKSVKQVGSSATRKLWLLILQDLISIFIVVLSIKSSFFITAFTYTLSYTICRVFTEILIVKCKDLYFYFILKNALMSLKNNTDKL